MGKSAAVVIFANPSAGQGRARQTVAGVAKAICAIGRKVVVLTHHPDTVTKEELPRSIHAVVIVGGDGTIRSAIERLMQLLGTIPPILPISMGTANLLSQYLEWHDHRPQQLVDALVQQRVRHFDMASANGHLCLMMVSVGFDAHVVHELAKQRTGPIDMFSYITPTLKTLAMMQFVPLKVTVDGKEIWKDLAAMAIVANLSVYGTGFPMVLHAQPDDGQLDTCILPMTSRADLIETAASAFAGAHLEREGVIYVRGKSIEIESAEPVAVQVDGDAFGFTPLKVGLLPVRVPFIVPAI